MRTNLIVIRILLGTAIILLANLTVSNGVLAAPWGPIMGDVVDYGDLLHGCMRGACPRPLYNSLSPLCLGSL